MTGNKGSDFKAANEEAGFPNAGRKSPVVDCTWHHVDDFDPETGETTMQLVRSDAHEATFTHEGLCSQYDTYYGEKIYNKPKKKR